VYSGLVVREEGEEGFQLYIAFGWVLDKIVQVFLELGWVGLCHGDLHWQHVVPSFHQLPTLKGEGSHQQGEELVLFEGQAMYSWRRLFARACMEGG